MLKIKALEKGILWMCNQYEEYSKLDINNKINLKSEIAYYWNNRFDNHFQKHIQPIFQNFNSKKIEDFVHQEYLYSVGL